MKCNVKEKTVPFKFDGKEYPLKLNFNVIAAIQDKYGDIDSCFNNMDKVRNQIWILCTLLNEAIDIHNEKEDEQWEHYTESQIGRRIDADNAHEIMDCIMKTMGVSLPEPDGEETEKNEIAE